MCRGVKTIVQDACYSIIIRCGMNMFQNLPLGIITNTNNTDILLELPWRWVGCLDELPDYS